MVGIAASLLLLLWVADSFIDGVVFAEGDFVQQLLHPESKELAYRLQTFLFLIFFVVYARRKFLSQERLNSSLQETLTNLATERSRSEAILAAVPYAVSVQDPDLKILYQNPAHKQMMGEHAGEFCYAAYRHRPSVCPECHLVASFTDGSLHQREVSTGGRHMEISSVPLKDAEGRIIAGIESVRDITDRKNDENRLRQQLAAIEASKDGIAILNAAGEYLYLNKAHAAIYGYLSPDELVGKSWQVLYTLDEQQRLESLIYPAFELEGGWRGEATGLKKDGSLYPQEISLTVLEDGGLICVVQDITERKKSEEEICKLNESLAQQTCDLQVMNQELGAFSYSLSHDLRVPLTGIYLAAQTFDDMYRDKLDDTGRSFIHAISSGCERMEELIDAMLVLSRASRSELSCEEVDLSAMAREIMAGLQLCNLETPVTWHVDEGMIAWLDPHLAHILLENLISNAWKYSAKNETPTIEFGQKLSDGEVQFYVRDNGVGFDMQNIAKIFLPFERLHNSNDFPGAGIGLATVQRIVNRHAGRIWAEGEENKGATFFFSFPPPTPVTPSTDPDAVSDSQVLPA